MDLKRYAKIAAPLMLAGLVAACASLIGPREVVLPQERLQASLDRKFPLHQRALGVFEVELSHPRLAVMPENDRVALTVDLGVTPLLARQSWHGSMLVSGRMRVDSVNNAIYIADAHVDRFIVDNMDEGKQAQLASVANLLSDKLIRDVPLHTFRPEELRYAGVQFVLTGIDTRPGGLVAKLQPAQ
ncbi:DUF1439 domain-containing protein [Pseudoduganella sp. FT25W]|uniref:DUF1439 domain-containing protein n=1 Tax=Duganella alba TaxID=2666081 RepID=A0A6L5QGK8_9BURK|nr:DUF1439 domain-containing protein [Duganella alba]MRX08638.1 DUF1439 domain-containing protein [Duganella alba]MRX18200.1 DUF1439 domain-containing protein [Duganella alba]